MEVLATIARVRDTVEIILRVLPWTRSLSGAINWYRATPLPSLGGMTARQIVHQDRAREVKAYLSRIADGGYA